MRQGQLEETGNNWWPREGTARRRAGTEGGRKARGRCLSALAAPLVEQAPLLCRSTGHGSFR